LDDVDIYYDKNYVGFVELVSSDRHNAYLATFDEWTKSGKSTTKPVEIKKFKNWFKKVKIDPWVCGDKETVETDIFSRALEYVVKVQDKVLSNLVRDGVAKEVVRTFPNGTIAGVFLVLTRSPIVRRENVLTSTILEAIKRAKSIDANKVWIELKGMSRTAKYGLKHYDADKKAIPCIKDGKMIYLTFEKLKGRIKTIKKAYPAEVSEAINSKVGR